MSFVIHPEEIEWLKNNFSDLKFNNDTPPVINGIFKFEAVYQEESGQKYPVIKDSYKIEIRFSNNSLSLLPEVRETGNRISNIISTLGETSADLHVNPDGTVCLCPYTAEKRKLPNGFNLKDFFNNLLIPYFYGQSYYEKNKEWPWGEYSHGELGLLEDYLENRGEGNNLELIKEFIENFKKIAFSDSYFALVKKGKIKGHTVCFCGSNKKIRNCHNLSFKGLWHLKEDIKKNKMKLNK